MSKENQLKLETALGDAFLKKDRTSPKGTTVWVPCSGTEKLQNKPGHVGEIRVALDSRDGQTEWRRTGEYLSEAEAKGKIGDRLIVSGSHGICPDCLKAIKNRSSPR